MNSKDDDDTLPLPNFSQDFSVDVTADEDFIPTSQPQSNGSSNITKKSNSSPNKVLEEIPNLTNFSNSDMSFSTIDATVPIGSLLNQSPDKNKSADFIPETETKKRKLDYELEDVVSKKKIPMNDQFEKSTPEASTNWEMEVSKIPESPIIDTQNFPAVNDSTAVKSINETVTFCSLAEKENKNEDSVTEILVDDSAETVELDNSENYSSLKQNKLAAESKMIILNKDQQGNFNSDVERCEDTEINNSSILLLDEAELPVMKSEVSQNGNSQKLYLEETIEDSEISSAIQEKPSISESLCPVPVLDKMSHDINPEASTVQDTTTKENGHIVLKKEKPVATTDSVTKTSEMNSPSSIDTKLMEFKLSISCMVTTNIKTKQITQKLILNVNEVPQPKMKKSYVELNSDSASDKLKRYSTSSSGSVYSDKTGLPFALPKRFSAISDQTDASDSSEEGFTKCLLGEIKGLGRTPWNNEYMVPMKMDEIMKNAFENPDKMAQLMSKSTNPPFRKLNNPPCHRLNNLEEISESSTPEHLTDNLDNTDVKNATNNISKETTIGENEKDKEKENKSRSEDSGSKKVIDTETEIIRNHESSSVEVIKESEDFVLEKEVVQDENSSKALSPKKSPSKEKVETGPESDLNEKADEKNDNSDNDIVFQEGLAVFGRWTDKKYYPGTLSGISKNDKWEINFDDGTSKFIREDLIIPSKWLKVGELVFAMVDDKYTSGQIIDIKSGTQKKYVIELDETVNTKVMTVELSDLCLTDVLVGIIKEKYRPLSGTPHGKSSSNIDFDNVLSGKRLREQKTPLRMIALASAGSTGGKMKTSAKRKKEQETKNSETVKGSPKKNSASKSSGKRLNGLRSENGHLVEDKTASAESPSETAETPLRSVFREGRGKAKPRSLSYEGDRHVPRKHKNKYNEGLAPDGTPIPGPSGIKSKKKKGKLAKQESSRKNKFSPGHLRDSDTSDSDESPYLEKKRTGGFRDTPIAKNSKRKRKLSLEEDEGSCKTNKKMEGSKRKTKSKKA